MYYLIDAGSGRVHQEVETKEQTFEVADPLEWIEHDHISGADVGDLEYVDGSLQRVPPPVETYDLARRMNYPFTDDQLDLLWHDMDEGRVPGKETSKWYQAIKHIKTRYPKPE